MAIVAWSIRAVKTLKVTVTASVLVSDEDFFALNLDKPLALDSMAYNIQSHVGDGPLLASRESAIRVSVTQGKTQYAHEPVTSWRR